MQRCPQCGKEYSDEANFCPVDAATLVPLEVSAQAGSDDDLLGGRFRLGEPIAGGRTGQVYGAVDEQGGGDCVIKVVHEGVFPTPLVLQRSERELKKLVGLDAPGVVPVLGHGRTGNTLWVATRYTDGVSLQRFVEGQGPLLPNAAAALVSAIGEALTAAAKVGVVHRDLAPKNVLVSNELDIGLINFGVPVPSQAGKAFGVPGYVAPEQLKGKPIDQRSNIYSLGALYYFMLSGQAPAPGQPPAVDGVSAATNAVLQKAMEPSPSKRFMTLRQMLREVGNAAGDDAGSTQPMGQAGKAASKPVSAGKPSRKELKQTLAGGFAAFAGAAKAAGIGGSAGAAAAGGAAQAASASTDDADAAVTNKNLKATAMGHAGVEDAAADPVATAPTLSPPDDQPSPASTLGGLPAQPPSSSLDAQASLPATPPSSALDAQAEAMAPTLRPPEDSPSASSTTPASKRAVSQANEQLAPSAPVAPTVAPPNPGVSGARTPAGPSMNSGPGGKGKRRSKKKRRRAGKGQFRETMWFKKGQLDAEAAKRAAQSAPEGSLPESDKVDELPMEDRYTDDGTLSHEDKDKFSLRTGHTEAMPVMDGRAGASGHVSEDELVREMQGGRGKYIAMIVVGVVLLIVLIVMFASGGGASEEEGEADAAPAAEKQPAKKKPAQKKPPAMPPKAAAAASKFVKACKAADAGAVWDLLSPDAQKKYTDIALKNRRSRRWRRKQGYRGKASKLDGKVYFALLVKKHSKWAACTKADEYDVADLAVADGAVTLTNKAKTGIASVILREVDGAWLVAKINR